MAAVETPTVGIINYGAGNIRSIANAVEHVGANVVFVDTPDELKSVTHLILPGVGAFAFCAKKLRSSSLLPEITRLTLEERRPLLAICVGMQLLADVSEEHGRHDGLGWIGGNVRYLTPSPPHVRVPHVGWNTVKFEADFGHFHAGSEADFYFDHSYALDAPVSGERLAICTHGRTFCAAVRFRNIIAVQFHPEKSQDAGIRFLSFFLTGSAPFHTTPT